MTEQENNTMQEESTQRSSAETQNTERMIPKARLDEVIQQRNAKDKLNEDLQAKLDTYEKAKADDEVAKLTAQSKFEELYNNAQAKIESLTGMEEQANMYKASLIATNQSRIERIPEDKRSLVPEYDDPRKMGEWLDKNNGLFTETPAPVAPTSDGSAGGDTSIDPNNRPLNSSQQALANIARSLGHNIDDKHVASFARNPIKQTDTTGDK